jgi:hypothetical protein
VENEWLIKQEHKLVADDMVQPIPDKKAKVYLAAMFRLNGLLDDKKALKKEHLVEYLSSQNIPPGRDTKELVYQVLPRLCKEIESLQVAFQPKSRDLLDVLE